MQIEIRADFVLCSTLYLELVTVAKLGGSGWGGKQGGTCLFGGAPPNEARRAEVTAAGGVGAAQGPQKPTVFRCLEISSNCKRGDIRRHTWCDLCRNF